MEMGMITKKVTFVGREYLILRKMSLVMIFIKQLWETESVLFVYSLN